MNAIAQQIADARSHALHDDPSAALVYYDAVLPQLRRCATRVPAFLAWASMPALPAAQRDWWRVLLPLQAVRQHRRPRQAAAVSGAMLGPRARAGAGAGDGGNGEGHPILRPRLHLSREEAKREHQACCMPAVRTGGSKGGCAHGSA
jgi:hypothetical protein